MRKVCVVITARASYCRVKSVLRSLLERDDAELQLVVSASGLLDKFGNVAKVIESDGFEIRRRAHMLLPGDTLATSAKSAGLGVMELTTAFEDLRPDVVVSVADRFETLSTAVAAAYMNIPLAHIQGGEITGSIDEKTRHAVTKLADLHFPSTKKAGENVARMGEDESKIFVTGCPSIDLALEVDSSRGRILDFHPAKKYNGVGNEKLDFAGEYYVVTQHPVTTEYQEGGRHVEETLRAVKEMGKPAVWLWPNADAGNDAIAKSMRQFREMDSPDNVFFLKNMTPEDFLHLLNCSACVIGNSSVAIRECSFLGVPAVNIGTRQNGRERGVNIFDCGYEKEAIIQAASRAMENERHESSSLYGDGRAGQRIARHLAEEPLSFTKKLNY